MHLIPKHRMITVKICNMECTLTCKDLESFICSVICLVILFTSSLISPYFYFHISHVVKQQLALFYTHVNHETIKQ